MLKAQLEKIVALFVGKRELLGVIGKNANAVDTLVNHAVQYPLLSLPVDIAGFGKRGWRDGEDPAEWLAHDTLTDKNWLVSMIILNAEGFATMSPIAIGFPHKRMIYSRISKSSR